MERALDESFSQIPYELLIDKERKPVESFIRQLEFLDDYDVVLLEDDVILCDNFKEEIEKVIEEHKEYVINFFTRPNDYFTSNYNQILIYNQCTYYPKGTTKKIAEKMKEVMPELKGSGYDVIENRAINRLGMVVYNYRPCLVQHKDGYSLINRRVGRNDRITPYFKNYLDEFNIDYNNPKEVMANKDKLVAKKQELIKQIRK